MSTTTKRGPGRPRVNVSSRECTTCGTTYAQTQNEINKCVTRCPDCRKVLRDLKKPKPVNPHPELRPIYEVVLPQVRKPWLCKKRREWFLKVRVRRKNTDEPLKPDRIWLGLGENVPVEQAQEALNTLVAKLLMEGKVKSVSREILQKKRKTKAWKRVKRKHWIVGKDRGYGIRRKEVTYVRFEVSLPDPQHPFKVHRFGKYKSRIEARLARMSHYREFSKRVLPCAICGQTPHAFLSRGGPLSHISADCSNRVQFPVGLRPLFQTKLWNVLFASGERKNTGILTQEDLRDMGFMGCKGRGTRLHVRSEVEFDFRAAAKYARKKEMDPVFE